MRTTPATGARASTATKEIPAGIANGQKATASAAGHLVSIPTNRAIAPSVTSALPEKAAARVVMSAKVVVAAKANPFSVPFFLRAGKSNLSPSHAALMVCSSRSNRLPRHIPFLSWPVWFSKNPPAILWSFSAHPARHFFKLWRMVRFGSTKAMPHRGFLRHNWINFTALRVSPWSRQKEPPRSLPSAA